MHGPVTYQNVYQPWWHNEITSKNIYLGILVPSSMTFNLIGHWYFLISSNSNMATRVRTPDMSTSFLIGMSRAHGCLVFLIESYY